MRGEGWMEWNKPSQSSNYGYLETGALYIYTEIRKGRSHAVRDTHYQEEICKPNAYIKLELGLY